MTTEPASEAWPGTARLERYEDWRLAARADTVVTDEMMFALIDSGRR